MQAITLNMTEKEHLEYLYNLLNFHRTMDKGVTLSCLVHTQNNSCQEAHRINVCTRNLVTSFQLFFY